jgi:hypothetical protein
VVHRVAKPVPVQILAQIVVVMDLETMNDLMKDGGNEPISEWIALTRLDELK